MFRALIKSMRPRQWTKNAFVLAAVVFDRQLTNPAALSSALIAFGLFCFISSVVYLINDITDRHEDRLHPTKKDRPIASGELPVSIAGAAAALIVIITLPIAYALYPTFAYIAFAYLLINLAYSRWLKHIPLIDVLIIATGFVLRVAAGVSVIHVERFSPWLYVVTTLFALYIGFGKRRAELTLSTGSANQARRVLNGYTIPFLDQLIVIVSAATILSYSLYTFSAPNLPDNHAMMLTIPFVVYGIFRYLYLIQVAQEGGAPEELLLSDRPLQAVILLWGISVLLIFYIF
ncbi:MAG: decaprenyl-phosphate phosphoribosyltransferase [Anaerolineaceae bacterium]|jgi:4-hydroxybenzoate polyprenyltransferase